MINPQYNSRIRHIDAFLKAVQSGKDRTKAFQKIDPQDRISIVGSTAVKQKTILWDKIGKKTLEGRVTKLKKDIAKKPVPAKGSSPTTPKIVAVSRKEHLQTFLKAIKSGKDRTKAFQKIDWQDRITIVGFKATAKQTTIPWDAIGKKTVEQRVQKLLKSTLKQSLPTTKPITTSLTSPPASIKTVKLDRGSSQYDIKSALDPHNRRPPACTFHALQAIFEIKKQFNDCVQQIKNSKTRELSKMQKKIIENGLNSYNQALKHSKDFQKGADLETVRVLQPKLLSTLRLNFSKTNQDMQLVPHRTQIIVDHLSHSSLMRAAWIKNGNEESFALVSFQGKTIVFDSHKNEISLLPGKQQTQEFLSAKLGVHSQIVDGVDFNAFSYALA